MMRVRELDRSLYFYTQHLGMRLRRREEYPGGRFTFGDPVTVYRYEDMRCMQAAVLSAFSHLSAGTQTLKVTKPMSITLKYELVVEGDSLSGKAKLGTFGTAKVTGRRV
jgi:hypothetical protein